MCIVDPGSILLAGYLVSMIGLNVIGVLISSFYERKFEETSPKLGFVAASLLLVVVVALVVSGKVHDEWIGLAGGILVACSGAASAWNSLSLYITMKRVRK